MVGKRKHEETAVVGVQKKKENKPSSMPLEKSIRTQYVNKQRVLVFCSRGITSRYRHFMDDLRKLLPHHKKDVKLDAKDTLHVVNEIAEIKSCNNTIYLEARKKKDLYMWISRTPNGPSAKFHVMNVHTMDELKMTGNALMGSRPILSFDASFDEVPHLQLLKNMFIQVWGTPRGHPKSKPFIDRIMSFYFADNKIWCRNYQIADNADTKKIEAASLHKGVDPTNLIEIGPRFVLNCIRIFDGSFGGQTLYQNPTFVSPNTIRRNEGSKKHTKYVARKVAESARSERAKENVLPEDKLEEVFAA